jgi:hypothetical protein
MLDWFRELSRAERKGFYGAFLGHAVDVFDFMIYSFLISTLLAQWGMSKSMAGAIVTWTLVSSLVGAIGAGLLADRFGRVRVLRWTILVFAVSCFLCGISTSPEQLMMFRMLQGLGFGGESSLCMVLVTELIRIPRTAASTRASRPAAIRSAGVARPLPTRSRSTCSSRKWRGASVSSWASCRRWWWSICAVTCRNPRSFSRAARNAATYRGGRSRARVPGPAAAQDGAVQPAFGRDAGRVLRHRHMAADVPEDRARPVGVRHEFLPGGDDPWLAGGLRGRRVRNGPLGPTPDLWRSRRARS